MGELKVDKIYYCLEEKKQMPTGSNIICEFKRSIRVNKTTRLQAILL